MAVNTMSIVIQQFLSVLREAFEGPAHQWSYFTDNNPEAGLFGTLAQVNADEASRPSAPGSTTIAAHVYHVTFALDASADWIRLRWTRQEWTPRNWRESWRIDTVDEATWAQLIEDLRRGYKDLYEAIEAHGSSSEEAIGGAIGAIAHVAYHLGAIRQKLAIIRSARVS